MDRSNNKYISYIKERRKKYGNDVKYKESYKGI